MGKIDFCPLLSLTEYRFFNTLKILKLNAIVTSNAFEQGMKKLCSEPALQTVDCRNDTFLRFVFDEEDMLKASCPFRKDKKSLLTSSGSNNQIHSTAREDAAAHG